MKMQKLLIVLVVLQALTLLAVWTGRDVLPSAHAQLPDSGAQRLEIIDQLQAVNAKFDRVVGLLESGDLQVSVAASDEDKGAAEKD